MITYRNILFESNIKKLKHLTHIEEAILHMGFNGARESIEILRSLRDALSGNASSMNNISEKFDGAPSIVFGVDPEDGQYFVGTKGVFAKDRKLIKSKEDLDRFGYQGDLRNKLQTALEEFPKLGNKTVLQGDLMYTRDSISRDTIDGEKYITFTPNTITYAVPAKSELAKRILSTKIGIIIHTTYSDASSLDDMTASPGVVDISKLKNVSSIWYDDPYILNLSGMVTMTSSETQEVNSYLSQSGKIFRQMDRRSVDGLLQLFEDLPSSAAGMKLDTFINSMVRSGQLPEPGQGKRLAEKYMSYAKLWWEDRVITKLKTDSAKQSKKEFFDAWIQKIDPKVIANIIDFMANVSRAKTLLINKIATGVESINTFVFDGGGYRVTTGEGYVISDKISGNVWKLVDRLEFSKLNFQSNAKFGKRT
jgi:hypothetical protein